MSPSDSGERFAVGNPSSRPRLAPCTTMPDTVGVWPSSSVACRTSPSARSSRTQVDDTRRSPSGRTSSTTSTVKPNVAPSAMSRSTSPAPRAPYRKSRPTSTAFASSVSTSTRSTNSVAGTDASARSNGSIRVASMPVVASSSSFWRTLTSASGHLSGASSASGLRSNVTTTARRSSAAAISRIRSITARWPRCTPSNLPIVTALGPKPAGTASRPLKVFTRHPPRSRRVPAAASARLDRAPRRRRIRGARARPVRREPPHAEHGQHERDEQVAAAEPRPDRVVREELGVDDAQRAHDDHARELEDDRRPGHAVPRRCPGGRGRSWRRRRRPRRAPTACRPAAPRRTSSRSARTSDPPRRARGRRRRPRAPARCRSSAARDRPSGRALRTSVMSFDSLIRG